MQMKVDGRGTYANELIRALRPAGSHLDSLSSARVTSGTSAPAQPLLGTHNQPADQDVLPRQEEHSPDHGESSLRPRPRCVWRPLPTAGVACKLSRRSSGPSL